LQAISINAIRGVAVNIRMLVCGVMMLLIQVSCATHRQPAEVALRTPVQTIDVAHIEISDDVKIRRINFITLMMGSSGLVVDAVRQAEFARLYQREAGEVARVCAQTFTNILTHALTEHGYRVRYSDLSYWNYFKPSKQALRASSDGILHVSLEEVGFFSKGFKHDYVASMIVLAEMIDPKTRQTIYRDRFTVGLDDKDVKLFEMFYGKMHRLKRRSMPGSYKNIDTLIANARESSEDLMQAIELAAGQVATGLQPFVPVVAQNVDAKASTTH